MKKDGIRNLVFGVLSQIVILALGLLLPRLFIVNYGSEINGLLTSVKQIFTYMTLLEAGIGATSIQALYAPISKSDFKGASSILSATDRYYRRTGLVYGALVIGMALIYPLAVSSSIPNYVIALVIIFQGSGGVIKYLLTGKYTILMQVDGKSYVISNLTTIVTVLSDVAQVVLVMNGFNIVAVKCAYFIINLLQMFYLIYYVRKHYKWLDLDTEPDNEALSQKNSVLLHSISGLVFNNTDTIVLTFVCGLKTVSVYSMYSLVFSVMGNIIEAISSSITFALGQLFYSDFKRYKSLQETWETYYLAIVFAFLTIVYIFILPFLRLYTASVTDVEYIDKWLPILFVTMNILNYGRKTSSQIINFAGHFRQTQWRSMVEMFINLGVTMICVFKLGIYGVLIGTIAALIYRSNDMIIYANTKIMHRSPWKTYWRWIRNILLMLGIIWISDFVPMNIESYGSFFIYGMAFGIVICMVFFLAAFVAEKEPRDVILMYAKSFLKKRV